MQCAIVWRQTCSNVAMPIISTVMGHQRTETTSIYISVDYDKLKQCALPMSVLRSPCYRMESEAPRVLDNTQRFMVVEHDFHRLTVCTEPENRLDIFLIITPPNCPPTDLSLYLPHIRKIIH